MSRLSFGLFLTILSKYKTRITDEAICLIIFPQYVDGMSQATASRMKKSARSIPSSILEEYNILSKEERINEIETISVQLIDRVILNNSQKELVLAILKAVNDDESIDKDTIIGFNQKYRKFELLKSRTFILSEFVSNILYYIIFNVDNKIVNANNDAFIFPDNEDTKDSIVLLPEKKEADYSSFNRIVNIQNPFRYNSNSTDFVGRDKEIQALQEFASIDYHNPVLWWGIIGTGGIGKSRLAYDFACSLDKTDWDFEIVSRGMPFTFEQLQRMSDSTSKNLFLIVDNDLLDMEPLSRWITYVCDERKSRLFRILICQRLPTHENSIELSAWYKDFMGFNEIIEMTRYKASNDFINLLPLDRNELILIAKSYIRIVYPNVECNENDYSRILSRLEEIDGINCRALYLIMLADALANGDIESIHNEDSLLNYAYLRERNLLRTRIEEAFNTDYSHNKEFFDLIERDYAKNVVNSYYSNPIEIVRDRLLEKVGMSSHEFIQICNDFGLADNGYIPVIQPDLLAEYFVLRNATTMNSIMSPGNGNKDDFWIRFFRDFNNLLNTKYINVMKHIFNNFGALTITMAPTYIKALYHAFISTEDREERERLLKLEKAFFVDLQSWLIDDPLVYPMGIAATVQMVQSLNQMESDLLIRKMESALAGKEDSSPDTFYMGIYDTFISNYAEELYDQLCYLYENSIDNDLFIDKVNEVLKLYISDGRRDSLVPFYTSHSLFLALKTLWSRQDIFSDDYVKTYTDITLIYIMEISFMHPGDIYTENHIKALMTLYSEDVDCIYCAEEELWNEIINLYNEWKPKNMYNELFEAFFRKYSYPE